MNSTRVQEYLSQMARYGEAASSEIGDDVSDVCRAAMDNLMLQIGIVFWLTSDHQRGTHVLLKAGNGEQKPPWLQKEAKK